MTETRLRTILSIFLISAHAIAALLIVALFLAGGLTRAEFTTCLGMVAPMFAAMTTLAVTYVVSVKKSVAYARVSAKVSGLFVFVALLLPGVFVFSIVCVVLMKAFNRGLSSFEDFKTVLGAIQTIFGAYTGTVLGSLFQSRPTASPKRN